jgi:hypothetical protein
MNRTVDDSRGVSMRKFGGAAAVLALHILIIAAFLSATRWSVYHGERTREIVLHLVTPQVPKTKIALKPRKKVTVPRIPSSSSLLPSFALPKTLAAPQTNGAGAQFFDCTPGQMEAATPEERAACASAALTPRYDPGQTDYRDHTDRSKSAALWARGRARKNAPFLLPCMSPAGFSPLYTAYCLGKAAVQGKIDTESQPGYEDMPEHAANDGDTRMAPAPR